ncbi:hypothetical protein CA13_58660 [Planctomycetes bacterium CA13]|uniref:Uncharacterized protein n=1 Tax=Novipirellula herctigrandis TaxID=2527986 RepID=A0A5C5ZB64_9BACT|nr:hypothetical protein CA13_58660 [Planctomycetes bacterium CA13]
MMLLLLWHEVLQPNKRSVKAPLQLALCLACKNHLKTGCKCVKTWVTRSETPVNAPRAACKDLINTERYPSHTGVTTSAAASCQL